MEKNIHICGIGNAIVDLQFKTTFQTIIDLHLKKGDMKLVDEEEQAKIIKASSKEKPLICSGGSAANTIIAFSQFGGKAAYQSLVGDDDHGKFYAKEFEELGINLHTDFLPKIKTNTCAVLITPDGERTMNTHLGETGIYSKDRLDRDLIAQSEWLYIEGYKLSDPVSTEAIFEAIKIAKENNTKIAFTSSALFIIESQRRNFERISIDSDLLFFNEEEAMLFTDTYNVKNAYNKLKKNFYRHFVITCGKDGAMYFYDGKDYTVPSYSLKPNPIDTTGAGDMFAGGFLYGLVAEKDIKLAGVLGSYSAGIIVNQYGARINKNPKDILQEVKLNLNDLFTKKK